MNKKKAAIFVLVIAAVAGLAIFFDLPELLVSGLEYIDGLGIAGVFIFIALYISATVAFIPGSILTLGAGFVFGLGPGILYVSIGSTLGATAAFLLGRSLFREWIAAKIEGSPKFASIDRAVAQEGWKIVLLTRLSPVFPFNVLNYAYGLTDIRTAAYVLTSWIGMLPGTVLYVYIGSLAGDVAAVAAGSQPVESAAAEGLGAWLGPALRIVGLGATLLVTLVIARIAGKALRQRIEE
jgi:uncharacterized membrane protein YdjX (TVP38/TMEM64 family)